MADWLSVTIFLASLALGIFFYYREDFVKLVRHQGLK